MIHLFTNKKIKEIDAFTIANKTTSKELITRAANAFTKWLLNLTQPTDNVHVVCGPGNNGADGYKVALQLEALGREVAVFQIDFSNSTSPDNDHFRMLVEGRRRINFHVISSARDYPILTGDGVLVDATFGNGLNRDLEGNYSDLVRHINGHYNRIFAIDVPSGLLPHNVVTSHAIEATATYAFEFPKRSFFAPEHEKFVGKWTFGSIGLDKEAIANTATSYMMIESSDVCQRLRPRSNFSHKGLTGKVLIIMINPNMIGAGILAFEACMRLGAGLVTIATTSNIASQLRPNYPEAIIKEYHPEASIDQYDSLSIGPGIGTSDIAISAVKQVLEAPVGPLVLDADALNIIAMQDWQDRIPKGAIITPHPKEFERLFGATKSHYARVELQQNRAMALGIFIILKGRYTSIACPDGSIYYNHSGNPALSRGGSGDVLTGMVASLLAQGYSSLDSAMISVFLHGHTADIYVRQNHELSLTPLKLIELLPTALTDISRRYKPL